MGFFGDLLKIAAPIVGTILGGPATGAVIAATTLASSPPSITPGIVAARPIAGGGVVSATGQVLPAAPGQVTPASFGNMLLGARSETGMNLQQILAVMQGRMKNKVVTVVFHVNGMTGQVVKMEALAGKPAIMDSDQRRARAFIKKVQKASARLPRKTVKESELKQLQSSLLNRALNQVALPAPRSC